MRIYLNCVEAITDIGRELKKCSTRVHTQTYQNKIIANDPNFETREIQGFSFAIIDTSDRDAMPNVHLPYCRAEHADRTSGEVRNPGRSWLERPDTWAEFLDSRDRFDYTYSERMTWQIPAVIDELKTHPETRQAIVEIHDRAIDQRVMGVKRVPCSMFYQLMKRDGKLDIIYVMRSTDFATHFQNDIWMAAAFRDWVAEKLGIPPGKFIMFASSLHVYKKDWDLLANY